MSQDLNNEIATRIRELRQLQELTTAQVAEKLGVEESVYVKMESGSEDLSVSCLNEISQILEVELSLLLTGKESRMSSFAVTRAGKGVRVNRRKQYQYDELVPNFKGKFIEPLLVTCPSKGEDASVALNSHPGQEMDYVLEGTLKVVVCGNEIILNPGDTIYYDSNNPHGMAAVGDKPAKFIAIIMRTGVSSGNSSL